VSRSPTGISELDGVLTDLVAMTEDVLGPDLVGVYLQGSFAFRDADSESDCDFVVVTRRPLTPQQCEGVRAFHADLPHRPGFWNRHVEGSYAPADELRSLGAVGRLWPYVDHGHDTVAPDAHCNSEVTRWILREHGIRLHGPPPRSLIDDVPPEALVTRMAQEVPAVVEAWERRPPRDGWSQRYAVATLSRMWFTQVHGVVTSKRRAMAWLADTDGGQRWRSVLEVSARTRGEQWDAPVPAELVEETMAFVRWVGRRSAGFAPYR
jgi:hypothetical protein